MSSAIRSSARSVVRSIIDNAFPLLGRTIRQWRDEHAASMPTIMTPMGFRFSGENSMTLGTFEPTETLIIKSLLSRAELFVNVGANIGYYCCFALQAGVKTIAVEPIDTNLRSLYRNITDNGWEENVEIFPAALAEKPGVLKIYGSNTGASLIKNWASGLETIYRLVSVLTFDSVIGQRMTGKKSLVVMDVEGAQLSVLRGAPAAISQSPKPVWFIELNSNDSSRTEVFELFSSNGYAAYSATIPPQRIGSMNDLAQVPDCYNFLFLDKETIEQELSGLPATPV